MVKTTTNKIFTLNNPTNMAKYPSDYEEDLHSIIIEFKVEHGRFPTPKEIEDIYNERRAKNGLKPTIRQNISRALISLNEKGWIKYSQGDILEVNVNIDVNPTLFLLYKEKNKLIEQYKNGDITKEQYDIFLDVLTERAKEYKRTLQFQQNSLNKK